MYTCDFSRGIGNSLDLVHHGGASRGIGNSLDLVHHGGASEVIIAKPQLHRRHDHFLRSVAIFFQNGSSFFLERGQFGGGIEVNLQPAGNDIGPLQTGWYSLQYDGKQWGSGVIS